MAAKKDAGEDEKLVYLFIWPFDKQQGFFFFLFFRGKITKKLALVVLVAFSLFCNGKSKHIFYFGHLFKINALMNHPTLFKTFQRQSRGILGLESLNDLEHWTCAIEYQSDDVTKNFFCISACWIPCIGGAWWKTSTAQIWRESRYGRMNT